MTNCPNQEYARFINFYVDPKLYYGKEYDECHLDDIIKNIVKTKLYYRDEFDMKYVIPYEQNSELLIKELEGKLRKYKRIKESINSLIQQVYTEIRQAHMIYGAKLNGFSEIELEIEKYSKKIETAKEIIKDSADILKPKSKITFALLLLDDVRRIIDKYYNKIIDKEKYRIIATNKKFPYMDTEMLLYVAEYSFADQEKIRTNKIENMPLIEHYDHLYSAELKEYLHKIIELLKSEERTDVKWKYMLNRIACDIVNDFSIVIDFYYETFLKPMEKYLD